jgi:hypothetical protein
MSDLLTLLQNRGLSPRKISSNHGGEYCSSCPVCGDGGKGKESDRFHIWPARENTGKCLGRFWCRQCGCSGDTITFLQQIDGLTFPQACAELGIAIEQPDQAPRSRYQPPPTIPAERESWEPRTYPDPGQVWQEKAVNLLMDCQQRLQADPSALAWLAGRGISPETAAAYGLGYNLSSQGKDRYRPRSRWGLPEKKQGNKDKRLWIPRGWVIPAYRQGRLIQLRIRRLNEDIAAFAPGIKYLPVEGSSMATMVLHPQAEVFVVVECGFDAILLAALTEGRIGALTTWNSAARPDTETHALLSRSACILGALDYDQGGEREQGWWHGQYRQYRRLPALPGGAKDPGDAAQQGVDLAAWLVDGLPRGLKIKLGFAATSRPAPVPEPPTQAAPPNEPEAPAPVAEIELTGGKVVFVTNDKAKWRELAAQGLPVFSQKELERLRVALVGLEGEARVAAITRTIELKEVFGGYVVRGREPREETTP